MKLITFLLIVALTLSVLPKPTAYAQEKPAKPPEVFEKVELLFLNGEKVEQLPVRLRLEEKFLIVESKKSGEQLKKFNVEDVKSAEYSYSRHPRWKSGAGTAVAVSGAAAMVSPLLLVGVVPWLAIPAGIAIGKSKSKRHWLTLKTGDDYAVLQLGKEIFRLVLPAIETRTGVKVADIGEKK